jgi:hypothetical protein
MKKTQNNRVLIISVLLMSIIIAQTRSLDPPRENGSPLGKEKISERIVEVDRFYTTISINDVNIKEG